MRFRGPESQLDWLAVVMLWLGAILFGIRTADLPLMTGAPPFLASHFWNVFPAVLLSIALAIFIYRQFRPAPLVQPAPLAHPVAAEPQPKPITEVVPQQPRDVPAERIFVPDGTTPRGLMALCENKTSHQAQIAIKPFLGQWIRVSGVVRDFNMLTDEWGVVYLESAITMALGDTTLREVHSAKLYFRSEISRLKMLQGGERIVADGEITEVDIYTFKADKCEIVSISRAEA